jgi:hypothetical protein
LKIFTFKLQRTVKFFLNNLNKFKKRCFHKSINNLYLQHFKITSIALTINKPSRVQLTSGCDNIAILNGFYETIISRGEQNSSLKLNFRKLFSGGRMKFIPHNLFHVERKTNMRIVFLQFKKHKRNKKHKKISIVV